MKRLFIVSAVLILLPFLSAVEIDMKTDFSQGETLIAKVSGNFFEAISEEDISFFRGHVKTSIIPSVAKIDGDFYIYAQLFEKASNNYSIVIEDAKYFQFNRLIEEDIVKNFSINENFADFSVEPGFIITDRDFSLEVKNLIDKKITINVETDSFYGEGIFPGESSITINSGETKKINFQVENKTDSFLNIVILNTESLEYEIPVYIFSTQEKEEKKGFVLEQSVIEITIATNSNTERIIYIKNTGDTDLEDIYLTLSESLIPYVSLSEYKIDELDANSTKRIYVYFSSDDEVREIEGQITANSDEFFAYTAVFLDFLLDYIPVDGEGIEERLSQTCSELGGKICSENQKCSGEINYASDGVCCLEICSEVEKSSTGKRIGWTIIFIIVLFAIWFYFKRYKGVKRVVDLLNIGKKNK